MKKLRVGVIYGGRSGEHEVSIASAAAVVQNLDKQRYEPIPIRIEKDGRWIIADRLPASSSAAEVIEQSRAARRSTARPGRTRGASARPSRGGADHHHRTGHDPGHHRPRPRCGVSGPARTVRRRRNGSGSARAGQYSLRRRRRARSAVGMDKAVAKLVFAARGLPQVSYLVVLRQEWLAAPAKRDGGASPHARVSGLRQTGEPGVERRHFESEGRGRPRGRHQSRGGVRSKGRDRGGGARTHGRSKSPCWATTTPRSRCLARSFPRASSTTSRPNIWTTTRG